VGCAVAGPVKAATFEVFEAGTSMLLGTFDAPLTGGAVTGASFSINGGVFDVLGTGNQTLIYNSVANDLDGMLGFGVVYNSNSFNTTDIVSSPVFCGVGECPLSFDSSFAPTPGEWYLDYIPLGPGTPAALDLGFYDIALAPVPLPASALLLFGALASAFAAVRKRPV